MTTPQMEEDGILREWAPLSYLLQEIPLRARKGLFLEDVKLTCVDAVSECVVVGTSSGIVYWYDRVSHTVQRLQPEKSSQSITCVKVVSSVDFMVAAGDTLGIVTIFRIPKPPPEWLHKDNRESSDKSVERYTVGGLHSSPVTALEWSMNGQKLFSGDSKGLVIFTEIDFCMNLSKAREILNERYSIVQLSYSQHTKALIVSTVLRCIISFRQDQVWRVLQIGQKERNSLLGLGGVFYTMEGGQSSEPLIYSCRPGLRLWHANMEGCVQETIIFREALKKCKNPVRLLRAVATCSSKAPCEFGRLLCWRDGLLVSHSLNTMLVIDPVRIAVVATLSDIKHIASVATTSAEIFVICGDRDLLRFGYTPDLHDNSLGNVPTGETVSSLPHFTPSPVTGTVVDVNFKIQPTNKLSANTPEAVLCASEVTYGTDTIRLPPVIALHEGVVELRVDPSRFQQLNAIGEQGFDDILYTPHNKERRRSRKKSQTSMKAQGNEAVNSTHEVMVNGRNIQQPVTFDCYQMETDVKLENEVPNDIKPDLRSIDSIVEDVRQKERLLEASLIFPENGGCFPETQIAASSVNMKGISFEEIIGESDKAPLRSNNIGETIKIQELKSDLNDSSVQTEHQVKQKTDAIPNIEDSMEEVPLLDVSIETEDSSVIEAVPSEVIEEIEVTESEVDSAAKDLRVEEMGQIADSTSIEISSYYVIKEANEEDGISFTTLESHSPIPYTEIKRLGGDWMEMSCPDKVLSMSTSKDHLVICCPRMKVYCIKAQFDTPEYWQKLGAKAQHFCLSPDGKIACKIQGGVAHHSRNWEEGSDWEVLFRGVNWSSVAESGIWYTTKGELFNLPTGSTIAQLILCDKSITRVYAYQTTVIVLSSTGQMMIYEPGNWRTIPVVGEDVKHIALGPRDLVWLVDSKNNLYLSENIMLKRPSWWQVIVGNGEPFDVSSISTSDDCLYLSNSQKNSVYLNNNSVTVYKWELCEVNVKCQQLTAEGVFEDKGSLWILEDGKHLMRVTPFSTNFQNISVPCNIVCVASALQALWLLSDEGHIWVRQGISDSNPGGLQWRKLNLEQIDKSIQLSHISCGCDVVWACDIRGKILMLVGSPYSIATDTFTPAWVLVDGTPLSNYTFTKVYVGPQSHMVWALDNAGNVYVREAIFPDFLIGTGWVHVYGIKASHLSISDGAVWALSKDGVYKRLGITQSNYIGDTWVLISAQLDHVSASLSEGLWGICSKTNQLLLYCDKVIPVSSQAYAENDWTLL